MNTKINKHQSARQSLPSKPAAASQFDRSLSSQLRGLLGAPSNRVILRDSVVVAANLPPLETVGDDGDLYINVSKNAQTDLGKLLAMESPLICQADNVGSFASMLGFWYFLSCPSMPRFATLPGSRVHQVSRQEKALLRNMDNVRIYVAHHMWKTVLTYPEVAEALKNCQLDFDSYVYTFQDNKTVRMRINSSSWWVLTLKRIREALINGRDYPDFYELKPASCPKGTGEDFKVTEQQFQYFVKRFIAPHVDLPLTDIESSIEVQVPQAEKQGKKKKQKDQPASEFDKLKATADAIAGDTTTGVDVIATIEERNASVGETTGVPTEAVEAALDQTSDLKTAEEDEVPVAPAEVQEAPAEATATANE